MTAPMHKARQRPSAVDFWRGIGTRLLPFADAGSVEFTLGRLLRLALFQISVGLALVLLNATLNRVMIVELGVSASLVAAMIALPVLIAPIRILVGHRSDNYRSFLGWRRTPFIWFGTLLQFGGLAIMPFALIILSGDTSAPAWVAQASAGLAFLLVGLGLHMTQTSGLALADDLAPEDKRPRVVALLYVMLLVGMVISATVLGQLLADFSQFRLIQAIQGAAVVTMVINVIALWKQEERRPELTRHDRDRTSLAGGWARFAAGGRAPRLLVSVALGSAAFSMQDILLEPYGGEILGLSVASTTLLTVLLAGGNLLGFAIAARLLGRGTEACFVAAFGALVGLIAFPAVILSEPAHSPALFRVGTALIGLGAGLFLVGSLTAAMDLARGTGASGLALGAWGTVQAGSTGLAILVGGVLRDLVSHAAEMGAFGAGVAGPAFGYQFVYHIEIALIFATLVAIGPLVRHGRIPRLGRPSRLGLAHFPG